MRRYFSRLLMVFMVFSLLAMNVALADSGEDIRCSLHIREEAKSDVTKQENVEDEAKSYEEVYKIANIPVNAQLLMKSECKIGTLEMSYRWDNGEVFTFADVEEVTIAIPEEFEVGSRHILMIRSISNEYMDSGKEYYSITIVDSNDGFLSIGIEEDGFYYIPGMLYKVDYGDSINVFTSSFDDVQIECIWNDSNEPTIHSESSLPIIIPDNSEAENGLYVRAINSTSATEWFYTRLVVNMEE